MLLLALLLLLFIFLPNRLHYVSNQSLLILTLTIILLESDDDPLNPRLGRLRSPNDGKFFSFHLVLVLLLIDQFNYLVFYALHNQVEAHE